MQPSIQFDDVTIAKLFGHEAAEDETIERLREYYFKGGVFSRIAADLPLRILVGHKGIGKSALFQVAMAEDTDNQILALMLRPDDVHEIETDSEDLLSSIRNWKDGLVRILYEKGVKQVGAKPEGGYEQLLAKGASVLDLLAQAFGPAVSKTVDQSKVNKTMCDLFLKNKKIRVYIDDLDRGWNASKSGINRLSSLLNALRDLTRDLPGLQFRISLRSDVYFLVRTSDESTDKIEGSVVWHTWTNHEILAMLVKRILAYRGKLVDESRLAKMDQASLAGHLDLVMEPRFLGFGSWSNIPTHRMLMSLIRQRPRDLVKLCTLAAQQAYSRGSSTIGTADFNPIFDRYSQGRLNDATIEFRSELPEIEKLLLCMRPTQSRRKDGKKPFLYNTADLLKKISDIRQSQSTFIFFSGRAATSKDLAAFLYKIGFLTARRTVANGRVERKYFEDSNYLSSTFTDFGYDWEVHPAFRWSLRPQSIEDVFDELELS